MSKKREVYVVGHKNPDTDSICSAISYAYLKNQLDDSQIYLPKRAGAVSSETQYVLDYFHMDAPEFIENVRTQVQDAAITEGLRIDGRTSVKRAWEKLREEHKSTLVVTDDNGGLVGLLTIGDIAKSIMEVHSSSILAEARTPYANIVDALSAEMLVGDINDDVEVGKVIIAAANPDILEEYIEPGDMVILGDRYESQLCAIEMQAGCLIVSIGSEINPNILAMAQERGCRIIRTPYDSFITSRVLNQSIPVDRFMITSNLLYFRTNNYIDKVRDVMAKERHREFPVLDPEGRFVGMMTRHSLLEMDKKQVILVDHNELGQAVDGLQEADLLEIVDHHKIGFVETMKPVMFRNQPVGCTATIVYLMYQENKIEIPKEIAGMMCSAIISDTLLFRSPTCTPVDRTVCKELAKIAGIDLEAYAKAMFAAGSNLAAKKDEEIFNQDFKKFQAGDVTYGIGQVTSMDSGELDGIVERLTAYMEQARESLGMDMIFFMLTDILSESTSLICVGENAQQLIAEASGCQIKENGCIFMPGVVSRKKQMVPLMMQAIN